MYVTVETNVGISLHGIFACTYNYEYGKIMLHDYCNLVLLEITCDSVTNLICD